MQTSYLFGHNNSSDLFVKVVEKGGNAYFL